jgi:ubiquinone biosynthesis protein
VGLLSIKHLGRLAEVAKVLAKYGFGEAAERLELTSRIGAKARSGGDRLAERYSPWVRIRMAAEELGPTFVKLGQLMSQRPDLLPKELIMELSKLQDQVPPESLEDITGVIAKALGRDWREVFAEFDPEPVASASLAQVHRAVRADDGRRVALKVRRPGVAKTIEEDLSLLADLAAALHANFSALENYDLPGLVEEIGGHLRLELDFAHEARHMITARSRHRDYQALIIPDPHLDLTSPQLLVMDYVEGQRLMEADLDDETRRVLSEEIANIMLIQVLREGFFHADPHAGNLMVVKEAQGPPKVVMLDWGLVGRLTPRQRYLVGDLLGAVVDRDAREMVRCLVAMGAVSNLDDAQGLTTDVEELLDLVHGRPLGELNVGHLLLEVMELMRRHRLQVQVRYALMDKALLEMEGLARELNPGFDPVEVARPFVRALWLERYKPRVLLKLFRDNVGDSLDLLQELPGRMKNILQALEQGEVGVEFKHRGLEPLTESLDHLGNRVAVSLILAALIVGSSMIATTDMAPKLFGLPALGVVGYLISGVLGLLLVWSILRPRKRRKP